MAARVSYMVVTAKRGEERLAAHHLSKDGYESYLALTLSADRRRIIPMFGEYLFARFAPQWTRALYLRGVAGIVRTTGNVPGLVSRQFVDALRAREDRRGVIDLEPPFTPDQPLRVTRGVFEGCVGIFSHSMRDRVHVLLSLLGKEHLVALKRSELEAV